MDRQEAAKRLLALTSELVLLLSPAPSRAPRLMKTGANRLAHSRRTKERHEGLNLIRGGLIRVNKSLDGWVRDVAPNLLDTVRIRQVLAEANCAVEAFNKVPVSS